MKSNSLDHEEQNDSHSHEHDHQGLGYSHAPKNFNRVFAIGVFLNLALLIVQVLFGMIAQSLALVADAAHIHQRCPCFDRIGLKARTANRGDVQAQSKGEEKNSETESIYATARFSSEPNFEQSMISWRPTMGCLSASTPRRISHRGRCAPRQ